MQNNKVWIAIVVVAIIAVGSYKFPKVQQTVQQVLGSVVSPYVEIPVELNGGTKYGSVNATSTSASMTMSVDDVRNFDTVLVKTSGAAASKTLTFFASSTASNWLPEAGDTQRTCFHNATTTAAATLVFAAGTGIDLQTASSSPTDLTLLAGNTACFTFMRKAMDASFTNSFDIEASMVEFTDGD